MGIFYWKVTAEENPTGSIAMSYGTKEGPMEATSAMDTTAGITEEIATTIDSTRENTSESGGGLLTVDTGSP